jgi:hypothetical protein
VRGRSSDGFPQVQNVFMPALVAGIRVFAANERGKTWMAGTSPAMTVEVHRAISQVVPSLVSFSTTPIFASSSRMRSDSAKFLHLRA